MVLLVTVFLAALLTALATGLGALPLLLKQHWDARFIGIGNAIAAGLMLAASWSLIDQGYSVGLYRNVVGVFLGALFVFVALKWFEKKEGEEEVIAHGVNKLSMRAALIVGIMTVHSFAEGVGLGVSFAGSQDLGWFITFALAIHNIPEGLAISLLIVPRGISVYRAVGWSIFSSLPQPLMAIPAFLFVAHFSAVLPIGLGFAAGAMIYLVFKEILPEAKQEAGLKLTSIACAGGFAALFILQLILLPGI